MSASADPASRRLRHRLAVAPRWIRIAGGTVLVAGIVLLLLATLAFGRFRHLGERRLGDALHRRVTIARVERLDPISFAPRVRLSGIHIAQPAWAGTGDMAVIREAVVRIPVLTALFGGFRPSLISIDGARIALFHDAGKRANWRSGDNVRRPDSADPDLSTVVLRDVRFTAIDDRRHLRWQGTIASDARGVRISATGTHRGTAARGMLIGRPIVGATAGRPWPFSASFSSALARMTLSAVAARPLDFSHFSGVATARGDDLLHLDDLLLIGLVATQPLRASAQLTRDDDRWTLAKATAHVGRSDLAGNIVVDGSGARTQVSAAIEASVFDFDDLSNDAGRAHAAAARARTGPRIVPDTRIDLSKLRNLDGRLTFHAARLLNDPPDMFRTLDATAVLDHARLTVDPLAFGLTRGRIAGRAVVTHPQGQRLPHLALDLALIGARLEEAITDGQIRGPLRGRLVLAGDGATIRAAVAHGDGSVALAARGGSVGKLAAEVLGRDLGAAFGLMIGGSHARTPLRCLAARLVAHRGVLTPTLFAIDTDVMRADGHGTVNLDGERLALVFDGRSKHPALVRLPSPIEVRGTLSRPDIATRDAGLHSAKLILKAIGGAVGRIFKPRAAPVPDADCGALIAKAGV